MQWGIFQGELLCRLLLITILIPLSMTLNSTNYRYLLLKKTSTNYYLFMDNPKLYGKTEQLQLYSSHNLGNIKIYWHGIWIDKCSTVCVKKGKICDMEDIEMPNGQRMRNIKENGYKYLGIIQIMLHKKWNFPLRISAVPYFLF